MKILAVSDIHREHYRYGSHSLDDSPEALSRRELRADIAHTLGFDCDSILAGGFTLNASNADIIVLAGDIDRGLAGVEWATVEAMAEGKPVIYVPGNHEYYRHTPDLRYEMSELAKSFDAPIYVLECDDIEIGGIRILGTTLWSDLTAGGHDPFTQHAIETMISDYRAIHHHNGSTITTADTLNWHRAAVTWLKYRLSQPYTGKTLVVTHHSPSLRSVHPAFGLNATTGAFMSDLDYLTSGVDLWIHGHTHSCLDCILPTGCRLFSNQVGYPREPVRGYVQNHVIEL